MEIFILVVIVGLFLLGWFINQRLKELFEKDKTSEELLEYLRTTNIRMEQQSKAFNQRLDNAAKVIGDVQRSIGEMSEIGREMKELQEFLKSPKVRGNIGEQVLKELLSQYLPRQSFHLQYTFRSGEKVDAAIKTTAGIVPIDSKFPMENYRRFLAAESGDEREKARKEFEKDVKKHIDDISRKYILTEEGTIDYALMYIPSEAVYYEVVNNPSLFDYAGFKRVLPVSPTTFYAYIKAILMSFEGQKIQAQAREILTSLRAIQKDYAKVAEVLGILQRHVNNAYNTMGQVYLFFNQLGNKITSSQSLQLGTKTKEGLEQER